MTPAELLIRAGDQDPARVVLTFYDDASGERAELSVATFANWVAKTANLLRDGIGVEPGARVAVRLPCHWQSAVWLMACWVTGTVAVPGAAAADVAVIAAGTAMAGSPRDSAANIAADDLVELGLGPMGLPRTAAAPVRPTALDYDREIHAYGDRYTPSVPVAPDALALVLTAADGETSELTGADLVQRAEAAREAWGLASGDRLLCTEPLEDLTTVLAATLVPLAAEAATVLCRHTNAAVLPDRISSERIVAAVGPLTGPIGAVRRI